MVSINTSVFEINIHNVPYQHKSSDWFDYGFILKPHLPNRGDCNRLKLTSDKKSTLDHFKNSLRALKVVLLIVLIGTSYVHHFPKIWALNPPWGPIIKKGTGQDASQRVANNVRRIRIYMIWFLSKGYQSCFRLCTD